MTYGRPWTLAAFRRRLAGQVRRCSPDNLKTTARRLLQQAAANVFYHPRLGGLISWLLKRMPRVRAVLLRLLFGAPPKMPTAASLVMSAGVAELPPRARRFYAVLAAQKRDSA